MDERKHQKILIVDDETFFIDLLMDLLQDEYEIIIARRGEAALKQASEAAPDLILLDVMMPEMDGFEVCRRLHDTPGTTDIPIIFLTALADPEGEAQGLRLGAVDFISKPINPPILRSRVRTHLNLAMARQELATQNELLEMKVHERTLRLRRLTWESSRAEERERRRIAAELHDGPVQRLAFSQIQLGGLLSSVTDEVQRTQVKGVRQSLEETIRELRTLLIQLSPPVLYELGLVAAVEWLAEQMIQQHNLACEVTGTRTSGSWNKGIEVVLFQAIRELLANIVKHADTDSARVSIDSDEQHISVEVIDRGRGFDPSTLVETTSKDGGFGLFSLSERIQLLGGEMTIDSGKQGTRVRLEVPALTRTSHQTPPLDM